MTPEAKPRGAARRGARHHRARRLRRARHRGQDDRRSAGPARSGMPVPGSLPRHAVRVHRVRAERRGARGRALHRVRSRTRRIRSSISCRTSRGLEKGGTMRLGAYRCALRAGSTSSRKLYDDEMVSERHRHRYEFNNEYRDRLTEAGLVIGGVNPERDLVEIVELAGPPVLRGPSSSTPSSRASPRARTRSSGSSWPRRSSTRAFPGRPCPRSRRPRKRPRTPDGAPRVAARGVTG